MAPRRFPPSATSSAFPLARRVGPARRSPPSWRELHIGGDERAERLQIERWAAMAPHEKFAELASLNAMALRVARAGIKLRHPDASEREVRARLLALLHGSPIARAIFPDVALDEA